MLKVVVSDLLLRLSYASCTRIYQLVVLRRINCDQFMEILGGNYNDIRLDYSISFKKLSIAYFSSL